MDCSYCGANNQGDEHRCHRCQRRLRQGRSAPESYPLTTATAPAYAPSAYSPTEQPAPSPVRANASYQRTLFHEMPQMMPTPAGSPSRRDVLARPAKPAGQAPENHVVRAPRPLTRGSSAGQQSLDFFVPSMDRGSAIADQAVGCGAPVAGRIHRAIANCLDISMVVMALGLFLVTFSLGGGDIVLNRQTVPFFAGIAILLALFYHFLFCLGDGDTPGMRWAALRLLNFDGHEPSREQRFYRMVGTCVSLMALGLGVLWALVDEETLTWHDHMSKTFPTPNAPSDSQV
ncbi:MAG: RDD family protein [Bryobacteraceae bacterium]